FTASANKPYHLWIRMRSENDVYANDSIHVQFSDAVTSSGTPTMRLDTTSSAELVLQAGSAGAAPLGWGWTDNGWGTPGANIFFETTGTHTLRIQTREDGAIVDQIVLSSDTFLLTAPGPRRNDATIFPANDGSGGTAGPGGSGGSGGATGAGDVLLHPSPATVLVGDWSVNQDPSAATGAGLLNVNRGAAKISAASASPTSYFEMTFDAAAGVGYRLW